MRIYAYYEKYAILSVHVFSERLEKIIRLINYSAQTVITALKVYVYKYSLIPVYVYFYEYKTYRWLHPLYDRILFTRSVHVYRSISICVQSPKYTAVSIFINEYVHIIIIAAINAVQYTYEYVMCGEHNTNWYENENTIN